MENIDRVRLGDVGILFRGRRFTKNDIVSSGIPSIHYGEIYTDYGIAATETISHVREDLRVQLRFAQPGDVVIAAVGETVADVGKGVAWLGDTPVAIHDDCFVFRSEALDPRYVAHYLQTEKLVHEREKYVARAKVKRISGANLGRLLIPLPPIEVQREIVRILDQLTQLEAELKAELEAELEARRVQLAHYRAALVSGREDVPQVPLGEIAEFKYGFTDKANTVGTHRFLRITDITSQGKLSPGDAKFVSPGDVAARYVVEPGDLLMARTGATFGKTMLVDSADPAVYASFLIRIRFTNHQLLPAFYWHFAQSPAYWDQANALVSTGGQPQFNANALKLVMVPVPSVEQQIRIIATLDSFDALINDISIDLPAEIAARRKQYEYYRDKLLAFEEVPA